MLCLLWHNSWAGRVHCEHDSRSLWAQSLSGVGDSALCVAMAASFGLYVSAMNVEIVQKKLQPTSYLFICLFFRKSWLRMQCLKKKLTQKITMTTFVIYHLLPCACDISFSCWGFQHRDSWKKKSYVLLETLCRCVTTAWLTCMCAWPLTPEDVPTFLISQVWFYRPVTINHWFITCECGKCLHVLCPKLPEAFRVMLYDDSSPNSKNTCI